MLTVSVISVDRPNEQLEEMLSKILGPLMRKDFLSRHLQFLPWLGGTRRITEYPLKVDPLNGGGYHAMRNCGVESVP